MVFVEGAAVVALLLVGCGRIGFTPVEGTDHDAAPGEMASGSGDAGGMPWALVADGAAASGTLVLPSVGSGHLLVVGVHVGFGGSVTALADDAGNTYLSVPAARATNTSNVGTDALELWYAADSRSGPTTIAVTATAMVVSTIAWEVSGIRTTSPLDTAVSVSGQAATTSPMGPPIMTATAGEFVVSIAIVENGILGTAQGNEFTNDFRTRGNGWAHLTDPGAPAGVHQAIWDQDTAGSYCANAAAFLAGP